MLRDQLARGNVIRQLAKAFDHWAAKEQMLVGDGRYTEAEGAHVIALRLLRAYRAEIDDPKPK